LCDVRPDGNPLRLVLGGRVDRHTRTDFVANGKGAVVYIPAPAHSIKLIGQSSANNGSADSYEHNYTHYRDDGRVSTSWARARTCTPSASST
jgi:hypothetical protein